MFYILHFSEITVIFEGLQPQSPCHGNELWLTKSHISFSIGFGKAATALSIAWA